MSLGELQELFVELENQWVSWVLAQGWKLRHSEGRIFQLGADGKGRRAFSLRLNVPLRVKDGGHMNNSAHYNGVGADWVLLVDGIIIKQSFASQWMAAGAHWKSLHSLCRWGGDFGDGNHISLEYGGIK